MPKHAGLKKIFVIGSGPIIIGQGCEFDYSGTQACKALREEGCEIVLLNSNPATVMTDKSMADATYIAPMTIETCEAIIKKERPDALLPTLGGQTALNLSYELAKKGILDTWGVQLIGASVQSIELAENRQRFRETMQKIHLEMPTAETVTSLADVYAVESQFVFPVIVRSSFTLGGSGSGIAYDQQELHALCEQLFLQFPGKPLALEESLIGWKEFEMEAIRDRADNCIIVCSLENIDAMGVHTGDSITTAPALTLCNKAYQRMRQATFAVLREIGVDTGGANVQFAVHPETGRMLVIEMNPRVSRSSALASKATGYPIAKVAAKLALGYTLDEIENTLTTNQVPASFEPTIDYVVTKFPRFNFEKFPACDGVLTTKMQSTGEVIGIGRNFQESFQKAIASLEQPLTQTFLVGTDSSDEEINEKMSKPYHNRIFYVWEALRRGYSCADIHAKTHIDLWFIHQMHEIVTLDQSLRGKTITTVSPEMLLILKRKGYSDAYLAVLLETDEATVRQQRNTHAIQPVYKSVDSCAAEFAAKTICLYSTYEFDCEAEPTKKKKILIIGSGPNRIGQGLEFDYSSVHAALAARQAGYETIMINSNPETVSTDYDIVDRLYLEPLTLEHVLNIIAVEQPTGVLTQFGGQTALNLTPGLEAANVPLLGTTAKTIDQCENRDLFQNVIHGLKLKQPDNFCLQKEDDWVVYANTIQYPIIARPSYLLSGSSMQVIHSAAEFMEYSEKIYQHDYYFPVLIERYLEQAVEVEVDGICDGKEVFIPGVMEQVEPAGIHSGDSICCFPPHTLSSEIQQKIIDQAAQLAFALGIKGLFNVQFAILKDEIYIIEVNPRSSRTVPYISKTLGISLPKIATLCILNQSLQEQGYTLPIKIDYFSIKIPVFPFDRLGQQALGPEMRSTGERMIIKKQITDTIHLDHYDLIHLQELTVQ